MIRPTARPRNTSRPRVSLTAPGPALPERWTDPALAAALGKPLPPEPSLPRPRGVAHGSVAWRTRRRSGPLPERDQAGWLGAVRGRASCQRGDGATSPCRAGLHALHGPEQPLSGTSPPAPPETAMAGAPPPYATTSLRHAGRSTAPQQETTRQGARRCGNPRPPCSWRLRVGDQFDALVTGRGQRDLGRVFQTSREGKLVRGSQGLGRGDRVRVTLSHRRGAPASLDSTRSRRGFPPAASAFSARAPRVGFRGVRTVSARPLSRASE